MTRKNKNKMKSGMSNGNHEATKQRQNQNSTKPLTTASNIFTLADEARQTTQHDHSFWSQETKLRSMPISFISAGLSEPLKTPESTPSAEDNRQPDTAMASQTNTADKEASRTTDGTIKMDRKTKREPVPGTNEANSEVNALFFFDTSRAPDSTNQAHIDASALYPPREELHEIDESESDGEVILFKGRLDAQRERSDTIDMKNIREEIHAVEKEIQGSSASTTDRVSKPKEVEEKQKNKRGRRGGKQARAKRTATNASNEDEDDGLLADYIANMRENGEMLGLLGIAGATEGSEDKSQSSLDTNADENGEELSVKEPLTMQLSKQTPTWVSKDSITEYADFDPMDWENPSIRRKKGKGTKKKLDLRFADIDSDTERRLQATWQSDRIRKAERKKEREQLRALNMLGKKSEKSGTEDMRAKYPTGMSLSQVADELKEFLMSSDESICLPPMDKHARKMIHELANKFNVKSKSIGKADQRRPTLYRTKRTLRFDDAPFDLAVRRIHRRYFPRLDYKGKSGQGQSARNGFAEASYRDGEIVGASAPELSIENRGRAMLEKMGWSTGTALGSEENKGILLPVTQTMKRSKAGLG
ncbi:hypothetical protein NLG97_g67 [Lecanicillium saksenae]|uniref:Uncharacterized protein n=1 Tax=Lecanicillium saksenae TaxID=468837 RepID=A0ACC1RAD5_9HYPO|nr:hypothetical protein NLG97_g67 [Lecanicillium saksenae]